MKTWFLAFRVIPAKDNEEKLFTEGALAHFWVIDASSKNAFSRCQVYLDRRKWTIADVEQPAVETTAEHFAQKDIGTQHYLEAQATGFSVAFFAWEDDGVGHA